MTNSADFRSARSTAATASISSVARAASVSTLAARYAAGTLTPTQCIDETLQRIEAAGRPEAWIYRVSAEALYARAAQLDVLRAEAGAAVFERLPLFGIPFAVKDNIDVAGLPTTAACPGFAYTPTESAFVVQRLLDAGAMLIGKTNLDQFATGLVGVRSPFGAVRQFEFAERVSGGSSSGSAVTVAAGCVAFSLGSDTAGSGRVPAGFNELVGLKPTLGLVSKRGVVPACKTLDTVSIFAHSVGDAWQVLNQLAKFDSLDSYSRRVLALGLTAGACRIGVPAQAEFYGDSHAAQAFEAALDTLRAHLAPNPAAIDLVPFTQVSALLYDGPWVAERRAAVGEFFDTHRADMDAVVAGVISKADQFSAVDAFNAQYRLAELKRHAEKVFEDIDVLIVPTTPTHPTIAAVKANPVELNSQLGYYTNFVNLLDLCALSVPCVRRADGLPAGVTLIAPAGADHRLAVLGAQIQALFFDAATHAHADDIKLQPLLTDEPSITVAVVGAHLRGQPLNWQLLQAGARFLEATHTSPDYRLFALAGTTPPKPGLVHAPQNVSHVTPQHTEQAKAIQAPEAIAIELWQVPLRLFGALVAQVPAPLGIGTVRVADGRTVHGFICEPAAVTPAAGAREITQYGGWLAYLASLSTPNAAATAAAANSNTTVVNQ
ncbi:allophanate hydrolase [Paraburkholderia sp. DHOC27]|uniref:allophanate hydrolase n=1 Tax=Paraburkholderia sp. DHOC27 TaxID=2303330 RepID=UPI000E3C952C|nr:allophanate hydrolase [Paraburkholderia sp. DHOC27]RFU49615.1 allophanate hydrolase [Paraburkholderia sp. DHOC27]